MALSPALQEFIRAMPKVELHVHLEGSIRPEILLQLARRNQVTLPVSTREEVQAWHRFKDFAHFVEIYIAIGNCLQTPADFELITVDFLQRQAAQNIRYSEVIFTPYAHHEKVPLDEQLTAINRARAQAEQEWGVHMALAPDISRQARPIEHSLWLADWVIENRERGIVGLGLGGPEIDNPPELFAAAFDRVHAAGMACLPHAGETVGPTSIWGALRVLHATRIGHGVRCLEDPALVAYLRERQVPLEVCPTSNVCLGVFPSLLDHPLPRLLSEGLFVTINSDDPPMFNTTLTDEYLQIAAAFGLEREAITQLVLNGVQASLLPPVEKEAMVARFETAFKRLIIKE